MRPLRIEMEGFMAYSERSAVDLSDADLFVFSGPTGSGKSSAIDAMIFALYGSTPRFGRQKVEPVLNSSSDWGRVSFEFMLGDNHYLAARRITRGKGVTEASFEENGKPIATGSREVGELVPAVMGLDYEQFTRAVVLPQGAFARFLTDTSGQRQDLLRALLDLDLFSRIKEIANQRAKVAEAAAASIEGRLAALEVITPELIQEASERLELLERAKNELGDRLRFLDRARAAVAESKTAVRTLGDRFAELDEVGLPEGITDLAVSSHAAAAALESAEAALKEAQTSRDSIIIRIAELPSMADLKMWSDHRTRLGLLEEDLAAVDLDDLEGRVAAAEKSLVSATNLYQSLHDADVAHSLRAGISPGDPCPVCAQIVTAIPVSELEGGDSLEIALQEMQAARAAVDEARSALNVAQGEAKRIITGIQTVTAILEGAPSPEESDRALRHLTELSESLQSVEREIVIATEARDTARSRIVEVGELGMSLRTRLAAATARLTWADPPEPGDDPVAGWEAFDGWRTDKARALSEELRGATLALEKRHNEVAELELEFSAWIKGLGLEKVEDPAPTLAVAVNRQEQRVAELAKITGTVTSLRSELEAETAKVAVASALGNHLKTNNFEEWVMEEAMENLVVGANELLLSLSGDRYALGFRDKGFEVIDRFNASQRRTTDSLSGGETFLVSLALSLAMASQITELSGSPSRLESIILDEGFDTLDAESLEVVGSVLDELVGQGRTVGVVTHVKEFAERIPVQFSVVNGPGGATITRVTA